MGTRQRMMLALALVVLLVLTACAPKAAPASSPQAPAVSPKVPASAPEVAAPKPAVKEDWQVKWDAMVEGAKKEGKLLLYGVVSAETRAALQRAFKDRFGVNLEVISGIGADVGSKVLAERRAGLRLGDVAIAGGSAAMLMLKPAGIVEPLEIGGVLILPDFSDPSLWWGGGIRYQDAKTHTSIVFLYFEIEHVARNTQLVKADEMQSYSDLLNPKWKDKIVMRDPTKAGGGSKPVAMTGRYVMGWDYIRALAKQNPVILTDTRLQMEWLARGKYPLAFGYKSSDLYDFQNLGMPVEVVHVREGGYLTSGSGALQLLKDAPHPNAAKLFINWLLTKETQTLYSRTSGYPSVRLDVPDEKTLYRHPDQKSKRPDADSEESLLLQDEDMKIIKELFAPK